MDQLKINEPCEDNTSQLPFKLDDRLIYYQDPKMRLRLCIPGYDGLIKEIFQLTHDETGHPGYVRSHERNTPTLFIQRLSQRLHEYLRHCPACRLNQTSRYKPYAVLQPIIIPPESYYTIRQDFIMALPKSSPEKYDCLLTVTDKFWKKLTLIPGRETYRAKDWAVALLDHLIISDWGLPKVMISDRDPKFVAKFWRTWLQRLNVQLLTSMSYHPQTDGQSERTNQTVEIALRYHLATLPSPSHWA